jgi:hypothetical protein
MNLVHGELLELLAAGRLNVANTTQISMVAGMAHGARLLCPAQMQPAGVDLVKALKPFLRNLKLVSSADPRLTLHLNGTPSFERDGGIAVE